MGYHELFLPPHFDPGKTGQVWKIPYQEREHHLLNGAAMSRP
jgi:hypothetical protein